MACFRYRLWLVCLGSILLFACKEQSTTLECRPVTGDVDKDQLLSPQTMLPERLRAIITNARGLEEITDIVQIIKLEKTEQISLRGIDDLILTENSIIVVDQHQKSVFQYGPDGSAPRRFAQYGRGEAAVEPVAITRWDDLVVVNDAGQAKMICYDMEGRFIKNIEISPLGISGASSQLFIGNRGYFFGLQAKNVNAPENVIVQLGAERRVLGSFGGSPALRVGGKVDVSLPLKAVAQVGEHLWVSRTGSSITDVYNQAGQLIGKLQPRVKAMDTGDEVSENTRIHLETLASMPHQSKILPVGDVVLVEYRHPSKVRPSYAVYNVSGQLLAEGIERDSETLSELKKADGGVLLGVARIASQSLDVLLQEPYRQNLYDAGFQPDEYEDDNPYIVIHSLVDS